MGFELILSFLAADGSNLTPSLEERRRSVEVFR